MSRQSAAVIAVTGASCCRHPVRLAGTALDAATGELTERSVLVACKDRRELVCPACAATYQADAFQLVAAGLKGGKGVPAEVTEHPAALLTLTAPSFGPVHSRDKRSRRPRRCHQPRNSKRCRHGAVLACGVRHAEHDPLLGQPLCAKCFDYEGAVLWNAGVSALWQRTSVALAREVATIGEVPIRRIPDSFRLSYLKVVEFQRRGLVHLHVVLRADGPDGPGAPPPSWLGPEELVGACHAVVERVQLAGQAGVGQVAWGAEHEVVALDGTLDRQAVAAYAAKYAVKASGDEPLLAGRLGQGDLAALERANPHWARLAATAWRLGARAELAHLRLRNHAQSFGFRGHFATKSQRYSTTFGALRQARADHVTAHSRDEHPEGSTGEAAWRYAGRGYDSAEAHQLAEALAEGIRTRPRRSPAPSPAFPHASDQGR